MKKSFVSLNYQTSDVRGNFIKKMMVINLKKGFHTIGGNDPLSGIDLIFKIKVLDRRQATSQIFKLGKPRPNL